MALFVIERNLAEQLQHSRDAARRVTEINRDIGVLMHNPVRRRECLRLAVTAGLVALPVAAAEPYPSKPNRNVVPSGGSDWVGLPHPSRRTRASLPSALNRRCRPAGSGIRLRPGHPDTQKRSSERAPRGTGTLAKTPVRPHETAFGKSM